MSVRWLRVDTITPANVVQQRAAGTNADVVDDYAAAMTEGDQFPPIDVFRRNGTYLVADGFHRLEASKLCGIEKIKCNVFDGGEAAAIKHACGANQRHGHRRTNADKRKAVQSLLRVMPKKTSDRKIAEIAGVSHPTVKSVREEVEKFTTPESGCEYDGSLSVERLDEDRSDEPPDAEPDEGEQEDHPEAEPESAPAAEPEYDHEEVYCEAERLAKKIDAITRSLIKQPNCVVVHELFRAAVKRLRKELRGI